MARIQKLESDSAFNSAKVPTGQILVYTVYNQSTGQVYHRARLADNSVVTIGQQQETQNAITYYDIMPQASADTTGTVAIYTGTTGIYTKGHTYQCLKNGNSYSWLDITPVMKDPELSYISFDTAASQGSQISVTFNYFKAPVGLYTNNGNYYPVEKSSVQFDTDYSTVKVILNPYLAYDNQGSFQGRWLCFFAGGVDSDSMIAKFDLQEYNQTISSLQWQVQHKIPWPTNSKITGYTLRATSDSTGVAWQADAATLLTQNYFTKQQARSDAAIVMSSALTTYYNSSQINNKLTSYYTKSDLDEKFVSYITSGSVTQLLSNKISFPSGGQIGNALVKLNDSGGVMWYPIPASGNSGTAGDTFSSANYYTAEYISSNYYTRFTVNGISSTLNEAIGIVSGSLTNKIDMPSSDISSGYVLTKGLNGVQWTSLGTAGGTTGDTFNSANYYTTQYIDTYYYQTSTINAISGGLSSYISTVSGSLTNKIDMPSSSVPNSYVLIKDSGGVSWVSMGTGGTGIIISSGSTQPQNPVDGTIWIN